MKPMKNAIPIAKWLLRFSLITYIIFIYFNQIREFNFTDVDYLVSLAFVVFTVLLIIGGFMYRSGLTAISGLFIFLTAGFKLVMIYLDNREINTEMVILLMPAAIGFYFFARGNKG